MATKKKNEEKRFMYRAERDLWDALDAKRIEEKFTSMNQYMTYIFQLWLEKGTFEVPTPMMTEFEAILERKQKELVGNLENLLKSASTTENPDNFPDKMDQVKTLLKKGRYSLADIAKLLPILEEELLIILGHLYSEGKIGYDEKWRYYLL